MAGTTPIYGFPYPESSDLVADYPALGQDLAEDIESVLSAGFGKVLQVVSTTKTDTFSSSSTSFTDVTGLSVAITPSSTASKILVSVNWAWSNSVAEDNLTQFTLSDGSDNNLIVPDSPGSRTAAATGEFLSFSTTNLVRRSFELLHAPATIAAFTYKLRVRVLANTVYVNRSGSDTDNNTRARSVSTITAMEIAA